MILHHCRASKACGWSRHGRTEVVHFDCEARKREAVVWQLTERPVSVRGCCRFLDFHWLSPDRVEARDDMGVVH